MTPGQYARVGEAYAAALGAPLPERERAARGACAGDEAVLAEVLAMLAVDQGRLRAMDSAAGAVGARLMEALGTESDTGTGMAAAGEVPARLAIGTRLGAYTLLRQLGEGGMGVVYLARQDSPQREVALKVMRPGVWSAQHLQRFRREAAVLARLHHPGIAQIYEAGVAYLAGPAGEEVPQPYFAFEYVDGARLDEHVRSQACDARAILGLLALVADAVHDAHEHGVVHRDLKPSNVLVDRSGQPKVLDFGVARAETSDGAEQTIVTAAGQIVGTLPYMSPEQVGGDRAEVDRRADVYAMGVIGYQLLTGRLPLDVAQRSVADAARVIKEQEPTRLSSFNTRLRGDIETIVGKALEKDRSRRYPTAAALASDIRRFLRNEPIDARPPSARYQLSKFARRNPGLVAGVLTAFVVLVASTTALWFAYRNAVAARVDAEDATAKTTVALDQVRRQRDKAEAARIEATRSAELAERTVELFRQIFEGLDPSVSSGRDTALLKEMLDRSAVRISRDANIEPEVAGPVLGTLGVAYQNIARLSEADLYLTGAYERLVGSLGERNPRTLSAMNSLAILRRAQDRPDEAEALHTRAYELRREVLGPEHPDTQRSQNNLAVLYWSGGRGELAEPLLKDLLAVRERTLGPDDRLTIQVLGNLATVEMELGRQREAMPLLKGAYERTESALGPEHSQTMLRLNNYGLALVRTGHPEEGAKRLERVVQAYSRALEADHPSLMRAMMNLGEAYQRLGRLGDAEALTLRAIDGRRRALGDAHADTLYAMGELVDIWLEQGRETEACWLLDAIFPLTLALHSGESGDAIDSCRRRAHVARLHADGAGEIAWYERALELTDPSHAPRDTRRLSVVEDLADAYIRAGRPEAAQRVVCDAISRADDAWLANTPALIDLLGVLAESMDAQGDASDAECLYVLACQMAALNVQDGVGAPAFERAAEALAHHLERRGRCDEAESWRLRGVRGVSASRP